MSDEQQPPPPPIPTFDSPEVQAAIAQMDKEWADKRTRQAALFDAETSGPKNSFLRYSQEGDGGAGGALPEVELSVCHLGIPMYRKFNCSEAYV